MSNSELTRRDLLVASAASAALSLGSQGLQAAEKPWHQKVRRWSQLTFNERDAGDLDVNRWLDYWASLKVDGMTFPAGGIMAMYPTQIPYHHRSEFLGSRDVFGELVAGCRKRGLRVVARLDPNYAYEDCLQAHPGWFRRTRSGKAQKHVEIPALYRTCRYGPYCTEHVTAIIREINSRYDIDGFFTNGWPSPSIGQICYCEHCRRDFPTRYGMDLPAEIRPSDPAYRKFIEYDQDRIHEIWKLWDSVAKEKKPDNLFIGSFGGSVRATLNLKRACKIAQWFNADHQGRSGSMPLWDAAQQVRAARAAIGDHTINHSTGMYLTGQPGWRHSSKSAAEARMWLAQSVAGGGTPKIHWLGAKPEDRRWMDVARQFFQWHAEHSVHFENRRSLAEVAVVWSQSMNAFYRAEGTGALEGAKREQVYDYLQGFTFALLQARIPFDLVHEDDLGAARLKQYRTVILPNVALLSDSQCEQLSAYAGSGGSLVATFETSLFSSWGEPRKEFGLAEVFGISSDGGTESPLRNSYSRIEKPHPMLAGLPRNGILPGAMNRVKVKIRPGASIPLTYIPPYPAITPEFVYPRIEKTSEPAVVLRESGRSRFVYFPGDVDRTFWVSGGEDFSRLLGNAVRWTLADSGAVEIEGHGLVDMFLWEADPGLGLHLLNYSNPALMKEPVTEIFPIGQQRVRLRLPDGFRVREIRLLAAGITVPHKIEAGSVKFEIPSVKDYEVAAIIRA